MCIQFIHSFVQIRKGYFINVERLFPSTKYSLNPFHFHKPKKNLPRASAGHKNCTWPLLKLLHLIAEVLSPFLESRSMPSLIAPYTLPSENTTEAQLSQNFSQMYILMGKALYSRNECCNNQLKTIFFPENSFSQVHSHFFRIFNKIIKFQYFSRTGKLLSFFQVFQELWESCYYLRPRFFSCT